MTAATAGLGCSNAACKLVNKAVDMSLGYETAEKRHLHNIWKIKQMTTRTKRITNLINSVPLCH